MVSFRHAIELLRYAFHGKLLDFDTSIIGPNEAESIHLATEEPVFLFAGSASATESADREERNSEDGQA
jgi:hypothetical protein